MSKKPYVPNVILICGHGLMMDVPPKINERLWCSKCDSYNFVISTHGCWFTECNDCNNTRIFGIDTRSAVSWAVKHIEAKLNEGHIVQVGMSTKGIIENIKWYYEYHGHINNAPTLLRARTEQKALKVLVDREEQKKEYLYHNPQDE